MSIPIMPQCVASTIDGMEWNLSVILKEIGINNKRAWWEHFPEKSLQTLLKGKGATWNIISSLEAAWLQSPRKNQLDRHGTTWCFLFHFSKNWRVFSALPEQKWFESAFARKKLAALFQEHLDVWEFCSTFVEKRCCAASFPDERRGCFLQEARKKKQERSNTGSNKIKFN